MAISRKLKDPAGQTASLVISPGWKLETQMQICFISILRRAAVFFFIYPFIFLSIVQSREIEDYTYKLSQSTDNYQLWTTPPSQRVFKDDAVPPDVGSTVLVYAAKNEFEPFQVVVNPANSGNVQVNIDQFGPGMTVEIYQVKYVPVSRVSDSLGRTGDYPDPLWPIDNGDYVEVIAGENTAFWFSIAVEDDVASGDYPADITIDNITIPVTLHVFNFAVPTEVHVKSQMNFSHQTILEHYGVSGTGEEYRQYVDSIKQYFIDHRLTPKSPLWSGGLTSNGGAPYIDYNCAGSLSDPHGIWGFVDPAARYLAGTGLMDNKFTHEFNNGGGFPSFMAITFQNNDASADQRPSTFCGQTRSANDWYGSDNPESPYNRQWFTYMASIQQYLESLSYLDQAYYYFANEPQDQADYDAVAWYSRYLKKAAPNLKLMLSEEPKPEIFEHEDYINSGQIDIWLPVLNQYDPIISHERKKNHGEDSWVYFLHGTRPPYYNPITLDHPGIESKFTGWLLWKYRISGIAYYSLNNWSKNPWTDPLNDNHNGDLFMLYPPSPDNSAISYGSNNHRFVPSIRFELMRDSLEDYEYLWILNNNNAPQVDIVNPADSQADKIINSLTSYTRDSEFIYNLRRLIGLKNGGEISVIPDINPPAGHPRSEGPPGNYYINFQDPAGSPTTSPLMVNDRIYQKTGWNEYDPELGYGWYGDMSHVMYRYLSQAPNQLQQSIIFDDWGRQKTFEFDLPNGTYKVTVSVGWYDPWNTRPYNHHKINIEGIAVIDDESTFNPDKPYIVRTKEITVSDHKLTMEMGIFNEYTMLNYLDIEAVDPAQGSISDFTVDNYLGQAPLTVQFIDLSENDPVDWQWDFDNDGRIDSTARNPVYEYTEPGTYTVSLTTTNLIAGDREVKTDLIEVTPAGNNFDFDNDTDIDGLDVAKFVDNYSGMTILLEQFADQFADL